VGDYKDPHWTLVEAVGEETVARERGKACDCVKGNACVWH